MSISKIFCIMQNNFQRDLINKTGIFKLIIPSVDPTRQNHSFSLILLIVQFREQLIGGASLNESIQCAATASISHFFISLLGNFDKLFIDSTMVVAAAVRQNNYRRRARRLFANYASSRTDQWLPERPLSGRISGVYPSRRVVATSIAAAAAPSAFRNPR